MPLRLDDRSVSRHPDRGPLYRQLANVIRAAIDAEELRPDEALPSEAELAERAGLSKNVVTAALAELVHEGLVVKAAGFPTRVAPPVEVVHLSTARYQRAQDLLDRLPEGTPPPLWSAFAEEHGITDWARQYRVRAVYTEGTATALEAARLELPDDADVLIRDMVKLVDGVPKQLQRSVMPLALVRGTPVEDPGMQPWPCGTVGELRSIGYRIADVIEEAATRMPTVAERDALELPAGGPVWDILRIFTGYRLSTRERPAAGSLRPLEASVVVRSGAGVKPRFETHPR